MGQELFQHANLGRGYIHQIVNWVFVDTAARMDPANNFTYLDLHKACYDNESKEYYVLQEITPVTFVPVWKLISAVDAQGEANTLYTIGSGIAINGPKVGTTLGIKSITGVANKTIVTELPDGTISVTVAPNLTIPFSNVTGVPAYLPASYVPPLATTDTDGTITSDMFDKINGIQAGATANATNAELRDRSTHTGTQTANTISDLLEAVQDAMGQTLVAGTGVTIVYSDVGGTITISAAAGGAGTDLAYLASPTDGQIQSSTGLPATIPLVTEFEAGLMSPAEHVKLEDLLDLAALKELIEDEIGETLVAGSNITLTYDDVAGTLTIASTGGTAGTDLSTTVNASTVTVNSSTGTDATLTSATGSNAGLMLPAQVTKLAGLPEPTALNEFIDDRVASFLVAGTNVTLDYNDVANTLTINAAGGGGAGTDLSTITNTTTVVVASSTGSDATISAATGALAGLMLPAQVTQLEGLVVGTASDQIPNTAILDTRLNTLGNLGTAAQRNMGTGLLDVPDNTQLNTRLGTTGNLGTIATQNANAIAVTGGTISGLSSLGVNGTLTFSGSARRISADFSNATLNFRTSFQTSSANASTTIQALPTGTGASSAFMVSGSSDITNASLFYMGAEAAENVLNATQSGSGTVKPLVVKSGGVATATFGTNGNVGFGVVPDTTARIQSANGIKLGNSANANTNVLDWYEEGSFTPTIVGVSAAGTGTYSTRIGLFQRSGNMVHFQITLVWTAHTGIGIIRITGLPFAAVAGGGYSVASCYRAGLAITADNDLQSYIGASGTNIDFDQVTPGGATLSVVIVAAGTLLLTGAYGV